MINEQRIKDLAYDYVLLMSNKKPYNPQTRANCNVLHGYGKDAISGILSYPVEKFCRKYNPFKVRDFVYKNDYFTPRNMYLTNPLYYIYFTYIVFLIAFEFSNNDGKFDFNRNNMEVFYSGLLDFNYSYDEIQNNSSYNYSYGLFLKEREIYLGKPALKIDIKDFFNSIKTPDLILKLKNMFGPISIITDLEYLLGYCELESLPQFHYSIASSILSQFYLLDFDSQMEDILVEDNLELIRYVDDMYIVHLNGLNDRKKNNALLNKISHILWEDSLVLNTSKTRMLSSDEYGDIIELSENDYEVNGFSSEKLIENKATDIVQSGYLNGIVDSLCEIESECGVDLMKYRELVDDNIAINGEDSGKILNKIIFSRQWVELDENSLRKLIDSWKYILFNPAQFSVLYILVYRYLEKKEVIKDNGSKIKMVLNYLFKNDTFTLRDTLVAIAYLFQSNFKHKDLLQKVRRVNPQYVDYIETYIVDYQRKQ